MTFNQDSGNYAKNMERIQDSDNREEWYEVLASRHDMIVVLIKLEQM